MRLPADNFRVCRKAHLRYNVFPVKICPPDTEFSQLFCIVITKKFDGGHKMSQQKVDRYKQEKAHRKERLEKEKKRKKLLRICSYFVLAVIVLAIAFAIYRHYTPKTETPAETETAVESVIETTTAEESTVEEGTVEESTAAKTEDTDTESTAEETADTESAAEETDAADTESAAADGEATTDDAAQTAQTENAAE